jgi:methionine synthase II (cobalamin-independent)
MWTEAEDDEGDDELEDECAPAKLEVDEDDEIAAFGPPHDFTGDLLIYSKSHNLKVRAQFRDGKIHGQHICYWECGLIAQVASAYEGKFIGVTTDFDDSGRIFKETHFSHTEGSFTMRWFDVSGKVHRVELYRNGIEVASRCFDSES